MTSRSGGPVVVDVGIPTVGPAPYLADAVDSVLAQTITGWRVLISEPVDHSCAGGRVGRAQDDPRVELTRTAGAENAAVHKTRLSRAGSAPYIAILDDDDRWGPRWLERRITFLERHRECGFVFSRSRVVDDRGRELGRNDPGLQEGVHDGSEFIRHVLRLGNVVTSSGVLMRRSAYEAVGAAYDPRFVVGYDQEMWVRLAIRSPVGYLDGADVDYRLHSGQVTHGPVDCQERVRLLDHLEELLARDLPDLRFEEHYPRRRRAQCLLGAALDAVESGNAKAGVGHARRAVRLHPPSAVHPATLAAWAGALLRRPGAGALRVIRRGVRSLPRPLEARERAKAMGRLP